MKIIETAKTLIKRGTERLESMKNKGMSDNLITGTIGVVVLIAVILMAPGLVGNIADAAPPVNATSNPGLATAAATIKTSTASTVGQLPILPTIAGIVLVLGALMTLSKRKN